VTALRLAVVCDLVEENWPSMDLVADMLLEHLQNERADAVEAHRIRPPMRRVFSRAHGPNGRIAFNADRFLNRFWEYPRRLRRLRSDFDVFHVVDHSYAQLVHELPAERTVVTCHDLDTFRCLLDPASDPRPMPFQRMMVRVLRGLQRAGHVCCDSHAVRRELLSHGLVPAERVSVLHNGVDPVCSPGPDPAADDDAERLLGSPNGGGLEILHVGSPVIPRKRIDVLLRVFAAVRTELPGTRLVRVGGPFTSDQWRLAQRLGVDDDVTVLPRLERRVLSSVYRRADLVLQPSSAEGFGLPVLEALACGTPVVASDLPVLREVGGEAVTYCPSGNEQRWVEAVVRLLAEKRADPERWRARRLAGLARAARFSWSRHAETMTGVYRKLLGS
jgi:glycosyltransferase involved in cell wall biosynthesis